MKSALLVSASLIILFATAAPSTAQNAPAWLPSVSSAIRSDLDPRLTPEYQARLTRGITQVGRFWREQDGDSAVFAEFVRTNFAGEREALDAMFERYEYILEQLGGHMVEIMREFRTQTDLDRGTIYPFDAAFAAYDPAAHLADDFFNNKLAFVALLNFPLTTLDERVTDGGTWTRRQWAEARLAQGFAYRVPADVNLSVSAAAAKAEQYVSGYNIWMHHLVDDNGDRMFPAKLRLLSHWNLRDEIKADYGDGLHGLEKQRMIQRVMEHIVRQTIPSAVIDNPGVDWNPFTNVVTASAEMDADKSAIKDVSASADREPDTRYAMLLGTFQASRLADPYFPTAPTLMARRFDEGREIPESEVKAMLEQVVSSPLVKRAAALIEKRLGRPLEPFDIWYNGFRQQGKYSPRLNSTRSSLRSIRRPRLTKTACRPTSRNWGSTGSGRSRLQTTS